MIRNLINSFNTGHVSSISKADAPISNVRTMKTKHGQLVAMDIGGIHYEIDQNNYVMIDLIQSPKMNHLLYCNVQRVMNVLDSREIQYELAQLSYQDEIIFENNCKILFNEGNLFTFIFGYLENESFCKNVLAKVKG